MQIKPYEANAKIHPEKQLLQIAASLRAFGWQQPIKAGRGGVILVGHGRYLAYQTYPDGIKPPWIIDESGKTISGEPETRVLTEEEEKAYRLADNKLNESDWNMPLVITELATLTPELIELTGFSMDLLVTGKPEDDDVPGIPAVAISKLGQVYQLGRHRLMCGDSTKKEDLEKLMQGQRADLVFTDPPYNVNYKGRGKETSNTIENDNMSSAAFDTFLSNVFQRYAENSKTGAAWYVFHSSSTQHQFQKAIEAAGWTVKNQIIWNKPVAAMGWGDYRWKHEPLFYCGKEKTQFYGDRTNTTVLNFPSDEKRALVWLRKQRELEKEGHTTIWTMKREPVQGYVHPTQKPVELITYAVINSSKEEDIVLDLFMGSGATLIAAEKTGRIAYGMELDPKYVDVILKRFEDYTGTKPIKLHG